jgi:hypothetical protein
MRTAIELRRPGKLVRHGELGLGQAPSGISPITQQYMTQAQAQYNAASASVRATIDSQTGGAEQTQRVADGVNAVSSLVQTGFDPNSKDDQQKVITAVAGGLALIPGAGLLLAGGVEALWQVGNVIACPVVNAFASLGLGDSPPECGGKACKYTGQPDPLAMYESGPKPSPMPPFGMFLLPAIAYYASRYLMCLASYPADVVVDGAVSMWNKTHAGPAVPVFVPAFSSFGTIYSTVQVQTTGCTGPSCNQDANVYFAFRSISSINAEIAQANRGYGLQFKGGYLGPYGQGGGFGGMGQTSLPRVVNLNSGPALRPPRVINLHITPAMAASIAASAKPPAAPMSTGKKVAIGTAAVAGTALAAGSIYAIVQGQAIGYFWSKLFDTAWGSVKRAF